MSLSFRFVNVTHWDNINYNSKTVKRKTKKDPKRRNASTLVTFLRGEKVNSI